MITDSNKQFALLKSLIFIVPISVIFAVFKTDIVTFINNIFGLSMGLSDLGTAYLIICISIAAIMVREAKPVDKENE